MRRILLLTIAAVLGTAAPAAAQATSAATPNLAGRASTLHFDLDGLASPVDGRMPRALELAAPGFRVDFRAVAKRCSAPSAKLNECPRRSLIGKGLLVVGVTTPTEVREARIRIKVYLRSKRKLLAVAYVFGWQVVPGTLDTSSGMVVRFDPLPSGAAFPNVSLALKQIVFDFGAKRVIRTRKVRRVRGTRRVTVKKHRVHLLRTPRTCDGSWQSSLSLRFPDDSVTPLPAPTPCRSR